MLSVRTRESNATTVTLMLLDVCPRRKRIPRDNLAEAAHPYSTLSFARSRRGRGTAKQLVVRWEASLRTDDVDSMVRRVRERLLSRFPAVAVAPHGARGSTITLASNGKTLAAREGWAMTPDAAIIQVQRGCPVQRGVYAADVESISRNSGELSVVVRHTPAEWYGRGSCGVALPVVTAHDLCVSAAAGGGCPAFQALDACMLALARSAPHIQRLHGATAGRVAVLPCALVLWMVTSRGMPSLEAWFTDGVEWCARTLSDSCAETARRFGTFQVSSLPGSACMHVPCVPMRTVPNGCGPCHVTVVEGGGPCHRPCLPGQALRHRLHPRRGCMGGRLAIAPGVAGSAAAAHGARAVQHP